MNSKRESEKGRVESREHSRFNNYVCIKTRKIASPAPPRGVVEMPDSAFFLGIVLKADISENGLGFVLDSKYEAGDVIEIAIQFHDKRNGFAAAICGEVKWVRLVTDGMYETGVQFINITDDLKKRIAQIIRAIS